MFISQQTVAKRYLWNLKLSIIESLLNTKSVMILTLITISYQMQVLLLMGVVLNYQIKENFLNAKFLIGK